MKESNRTLIIMSVLILISLTAGWIIRTVYDGRVVGLYSNNNTINNYYYPGKWIHINTNGISYERAVEVCNHEVAHKLFDEKFAEVCEKNITKCIEFVK